jgi:predicted GIY-YIG superfamily endonuclease
VQQSPFVVYRFFDADGACIYVGVSKRFAVRCRQHSEKAWFALVSAVQIEPFASRLEALERERDLIAEIQPRYNRHPGMTTITAVEPQGMVRVAMMMPAPMFEWLRARASAKGLAISECAMRLMEDAMEFEDEYERRFVRAHRPRA